MNVRPTLISAATIALLKPGSRLKVRAPCIITPSAAELAARRGVTIERIETAPGSLENAAGSAPGSSLPDDPETPPLATLIESTLLTADASPDQVRALCAQAIELGCHAVCVNPLFVPLAATLLGASRVAVVTVCGFPLGASTSAIKVAEARLAREQGADEIDMVLPVGYLKAGDFAAVGDDIRAVREALSAPETILKVIIEAPLLTDREKIAAAVIAMEAGAEFVKTGTGFAGPAAIDDVRLLRRSVGDRGRIKAAGGIRDHQAALALVAAGADRIGTSSAAAVLRHSGCVGPDEVSPDVTGSTDH